MTDRGGRVPLHYAETAAEVRREIAQGADINARDRQGFTPLHFAPVMPLMGPVDADHLSSVCLIGLGIACFGD